MKRSLSLLLVPVVLAACSDQERSPVAPDTEASLGPSAAPLLMAKNPAKSIKDEYVVVLREGAIDPAALAARKGLKKLKHVYGNALKGFAAELNAEQLAALRNDPHVAYIEQDQEVTIATTQTNATWGLDRIDQRSLPLSGSYTYTPTGGG